MCISLSENLLTYSFYVFGNKKSKVRQKAKILNGYNQIPHLTKITISKSDKNTRKMTYKRSALNFPESDPRAARNRQSSMTHTQKNTNNKKIIKQLNKMV